jgi:hypothetical protein
MNLEIQTNTWLTMSIPQNVGTKCENYIPTQQQVK